MSDDLKERLRLLADKFSAGWHEGIEIDATDVMDLSEAANRIEDLEANLETWERAGKRHRQRATRIAELEAEVERLKQERDRPGAELAALRKRESVPCQVCGGPTNGYVGVKYCSPACRQKAQ